MKVRMRKSLGVLLAFMMILTSISVAFVAFAAGEFEALVAALEAIPNGEEENFMVTETHADTVAPSTAATVRAHKIQDNTSDGSILEVAAKFSAYFNASGTLSTGGATAATAQGTANNTWWTKLYNNIIADARIDAKYYPLINALCDNAANRGTHFNLDYSDPDRRRGTITGVSSSNRYLRVDVTVTRTEFQALKGYGTDIVSMPNSVQTNQTYARTGYAQATSGSTNYWYFNTTVTNPTAATSNTLVNRLKAIDSWFTDAKLAENPTDYDMAEIQTAVSGNTSVMNQLNQLTAEEKATFFEASKLTAIDQYVAACDDAYAILLFKGDVEYFQAADGFIDYVNAGYDTSVAAIPAMDAKWTEMSVHYERLMTTATAAQREILVRLCGLNMDPINVARDQLFYDLQTAQLRDLKVKLDALYDEYYLAPNADKNQYRDYDNALVLVLHDELTEYLAIVNNKTPAYIDEIFTTGTGYVEDFIDGLTYELKYRDIGAINFGQRAYYLGIATNDFSKVKSDKVIEEIKTAKNRISALLADQANAQANLSPADFDFLYAGALDDANAAIERLQRVAEIRFAEQVASAKKAYQDVGELTWDNFALVKSLVNMIDEVIYKYFEADANYIDEDTRADYAWLKGAVIDEYNAFIKDGGYDRFVQLQLDPYPYRDVMVNDLVKALGYEVTEENLENVLNVLDGILTGPDFAALTGMDFSACVNGFTGSMCNDAMVNCIVYLLYPTVLGALEDAWGGLPASVSVDPATANLTIDSLFSVLGDGNTTTRWTSSPGGTNASWGEGGLFPWQSSYNTMNTLAVYPNMMGNKLPAEFATVKAQLNSAVAGKADSYWALGNAAGNPNKKSTGIWNDSAIYDGSKLTLDWGVDNPTNATMQAMTQSERFRHALSNALLGLDDLLGALLLGQPYEAYATRVAQVTISYLTMSANANPTFLELIATGNNGYAKVLTPIFEALLGEDIGILPTAAELEAFDSPFQLYDAIVDPLKAFLNKLATAPLNTLAEALPNLSYAMSFDVVQQLFNELAVFVKYTPDGQVKGCSCIVNQVPKMESGKYAGRNMILGAADLSGAIAVNLYEEMFVKPENPPINLSCFSDLNGFLQTVPSCFMGDGCSVDIPTINAGCLARLGEMDTTMETKRVSGDGVWSRAADGTPIEQIQAPVCTEVRHYIKTDKADFTYALLQYILDPNVLSMVTGLVAGDGCNLADNEIVSGLANNTDNVIAALVELLNPEKYDLKPTVVAADVAAAQAGNASITQTVTYSQIWTRNHANYLAYHLDDFVAKTMQLLFGQNLDELLLSSLGGSVYNHQTLEMLFGMLKDLVGDLDLSDILDMVEPLINIPISPILDLLNTDVSALVFTDGNRDEFLAAVNDLLAPLVPLLDVLLTGKNIELFGGEIKAYGYDGYAYGLIPLLEAIGCDQALIKTPAEFEADASNKIANILSPIFNLLDKILKDPVAGILEILPNVMYYANSGLLQNSVNNLLQPVFVLLDVIRPIFDIPLNLDLSMAGILGLVTDALGMELPFDVGSLIAGQLTLYESKNGEKAVRINNAGYANQADYLTQVLRTVIKILLYGDNMEALKETIASYGVLDEANLKTVSGLLDKFQGMTVDTVLYVLFYLIFGLDQVVDSANTAIVEANRWLKEVSEYIDQNAQSESLKQLAVVAKDLINKYFSDIISTDPPGVAPNGLLAFFLAIINFFKRLFGIA